MSKHNIHNDAAPAMLKATLYLGAGFPEPVTIAADNAAGIAAGTYTEVSEEMFAHYLTDVTAQFPGFTLGTSQGYWKGKPETVRTLVLLAPDAGNFRNSVRGLAEKYKTMFGQEAVAYDFTPCQFALDCWPYGPPATYHKPGLGY